MNDLTSGVRHSSPPLEPCPGMHAYPRDLAQLVRQRWAAVRVPEDRPGETVAADATVAPNSTALEQLVSVCYQTSLLLEEGRAITFRVALAEPGAFPARAGPPKGLHRLVFQRPRPFDAQELRRLAAAAPFQHSLIGVRVAARGELEVWGLIHSGPRWLQAMRGGRRIKQRVPAVLMAAVSGPGRVLVSKGTKTVAALAAGTLTEMATDVFDAPWLAEVFAKLHAAQWAKHVPDPVRAETHGSLDPAFGHKLGEHVLRRIVATIRGARHGGTLIIVPTARAEDLVADSRYLTLKYRFSDEEPRRRIFSLTVRMMDRVASLCLRAAPGTVVGWTEYEASTDSRLAALDEALFEAAHLVAMLAEVDGAVVMTDNFEILGFGAEISGALPEVETIERGLDLGGLKRTAERADRAGTRHRSSYRLCQQLADVLVIVVSQDGGVRFVRQQAGRVTYFDQIATGPWEV